ncbi:MAG: hypothetical protein OXI08_02945 [Cyanobacteria bacterium MAG IRC4_bin_6]|nr:hypothetical protein [Cyanobacteria bacterium MAG IRC4_bin_6]
MKSPVRVNWNVTGREVVRLGEAATLNLVVFPSSRPEVWGLEKVIVGSVCACAPAPFKDAIAMPANARKNNAAERTGSKEVAVKKQRSKVDRRDPGLLIGSGAQSTYLNYILFLLMKRIVIPNNSLKFMMYGQGRREELISNPQFCIRRPWGRSSWLDSVL